MLFKAEVITCQCSSGLLEVWQEAVMTGGCTSRRNAASFILLCLWRVASAMKAWIVFRVGNDLDGGSSCRSKEMDSVRSPTDFAEESVACRW